LVAKTGILEKGGKVDSVMCGSAAGCGASWTHARYITMAAGLPFETSASFVEMQCGSAIDSINHAAWKILSGCADVIIAGGFESHSNKTVKYSTTVQPYKGLGPQALVAVIREDPK
jgi:acetyl-CoA C-acetyltransferase